MAWFKVDDKLFSHPKWLACSAPARALWVTAGSWAGAQEDCGKVPRHALSLLGGRARDAAELEAVRLWEPEGDGWVFHDWAEFQPTPEEIAEKRAKAAERQRRARDKARASQRDKQRTNGSVTDPPTRPAPATPQTPLDSRPSVPPVEQVLAEIRVDPSEVAPMPPDLRQRLNGHREPV